MTKPLRPTLIFCLVGLTLLSIVIGIRLYIPVFFERTVLPAIFEKAGVELLAGRVKHVGLAQAEIDKLAIKTDELRYLSIDAVQLDYSLAGLLRKHFAAITLSGLLLEVSYEQNKIKVGELILPDKEPLYRSLRPSNRDILKRTLAIDTERFIIRKSRAKLHHANQTWTVPFEIDISKIDIQRGDLKGFGKFGINDNHLSFTATLSQHFQLLDLSIKGEQIRINKLAAVVGGYLPLRATGPLDIQFHVETLLHINQPRLVDLAVHLNGTALKISDYTITGLRGPAGQEQPITLHVIGRPGFYELTINAARLDAPVQMRIDEIKGRIRLNQTYLNLDAMARTQLEKLSLVSDTASEKALFELTQPVAINWHIESRLSKEKGMHWNLSRHCYTTDPPIRVEGLSFRRPLIAELKHFFVKGHLSKEKLDLESNALFQKMAMKTDDAHFECLNMKMDLDMSFDFSDAATSINGSVNTEFDKIYWNADGITTTFQRPLLSCSMDNRPSGSWNLGATAFVKDSWIQMQDSKILFLDGLYLQLPLQLSTASKKPDGSANIKKIFFNRKLIGSLKGQLCREENSVVYKGRFSNKKAPGATITVYGIMGLKGFKILWNSFERQSFKALQPHKIHYNFAGINMTGTTYEDYLNGIVEGKFPQLPGVKGAHIDGRPPRYPK
jgi:hypothetical protein